MTCTGGSSVVNGHKLKHKFLHTCHRLTVCPQEAGSRRGPSPARKNDRSFDGQIVGFIAFRKGPVVQQVVVGVGWRRVPRARVPGSICWFLGCIRSTPEAKGLSNMWFTLVVFRRCMVQGLFPAAFVIQGRSDPRGSLSKCEGYTCVTCSTCST